MGRCLQETSIAVERDSNPKAAYTDADTTVVRTAVAVTVAPTVAVAAAIIAAAAVVRTAVVGGGAVAVAATVVGAAIIAVGTAIIASRGHAGAAVGLCFSSVELQLEAAVGRGTRGNRDGNHHCSREQKSSE